VDLQLAQPVCPNVRGQMSEPGANETLTEAVAERFYVVNGRHTMTADDDAYASEWFIGKPGLQRGPHRLLG
jgi:hypothetical protein